MHTDTVDYPFDMTGLSSYDRAMVMASNPDCLVDLTVLDPIDRAYVMAKRPDCPIDMCQTGSL